MIDAIASKITYILPSLPHKRFKGEKKNKTKTDIAKKFTLPWKTGNQAISQAYIPRVELYKMLHTF